jgi:CHASE2 domain-containing sensor protein
LVLLISPLGRSLTSLSFDLLYLFRPTTDSAMLKEIVILSMDEESRAKLGQDPDRPWDRTVHARLLRELKARGAKVVAFDVLFDEPSPNPQADQQFSDAIREQGNVVLAASVQTSKDVARPESTRLLHPVEPIGSTAPWGVVEWPQDAGTSLVLRKQFSHLEFTNFAWQAAVAFGKAPADRLAPRWLNYYGPEGSVPTASYHRALEPDALPHDYFAGKAVFVGKGGVITSAGQSRDRYATPISRWRGGLASGTEIQATAFLNLVRTEWLEEFSPPMELLILVFSGLVLGFGLRRAGPLAATAIASIVALGVAAATVSLAWGAHRWFPWLVISGVQVPCALGCSILAFARRLAAENENLERRAALAESIGALQAREEPHGTVGAKMDASPSPPKPGFASEAQAPPIPNHRLLRRIGRGSYGEVWLARDEIGTYHAVKVVYQRSFSSSAPYEREFRGIQKFTPLSRSHPGFVHILHVGRNDLEGYFFYIMELGDDENTGQEIDPATYSPKSLAKKLEAGRLPLPECIQLGLDLTAALKHLHQHQLVHRDIKPSNIIFVNRAPKFADVGLVTDITPRGKDASLVGTEGYIAPEGPGSAAADIYSLGKVLYEVCTGRDRQEFPSLSGTLIASGEETLKQLNEIILKACDPDAAHRYQSTAQMHDDLLRMKH